MNEQENELEESEGNLNNPVKIRNCSILNNEVQRNRSFMDTVSQTRLYSYIKKLERLVEKECCIEKLNSEFCTII